MSANRPCKDVLNCANGWPSSILWLMWAGGKDDVPVIADYAKISLICAGAQSSTICTFWPVPKHFQLSCKPPLDFLNGSLGFQIEMKNNDHL